MRINLKYILAGMALGSFLGVAGCEVETYPEAYPAADYVAPYPAGYDVYYYGGWYDGPYWYWRDRYGHVYHEARAMHEDRARREHFDEHAVRGAYERRSAPEARVAHPGPAPAHEAHSAEERPWRRWRSRRRRTPLVVARSRWTETFAELVSMPELPEVQTIVNSLRPRLIGCSFSAVRLKRNDIVQPPGFRLASRLKGRLVRAIDRRGKRIVFTLDNEDQFYVHLGMSGQLTVVEDAKVPHRPHTHLLIGLSSGAQLRFCDPRRFGGIWWLGAGDDCGNGMGPEPLTIRPRQLAKRLARTRRAIKTALLDQTVLAGLGNIYADEALFAAGIHPLTRAADLSTAQISRLARSIKLTLRRAIVHGGSTLRDYVDANGSSGRYQRRHQVYGRGGEPCRRCGSTLDRIIVGGRSTHFCSHCQPCSKKVSINSDRSKFGRQSRTKTQ